MKCLIQVIKQAYKWFPKPSFLIAISLTCFITVSLPTRFQELLGYNELIKPIKGYFGLLGIMFFVFGAVSVFVHYIIPYIIQFFQWLSFCCKRKYILKSLSRQEKECLAKYLKTDCSCLSFNSSDGVINMLMLKNIVRLPSNLGNYGSVDYCLLPWVDKICRKNPDIKKEIIDHYVVIL